MSDKNLSIKDIAAMSGVSAATVSRVINKTGRFSEKTEKRVMEIIKATNFTPNMVARGLRVNQMNNIGILVPDITNEFFAKLVSGIQTELFKLNYHSFICNTNEDPVMEQEHFKALQTQNVAGIIYIGGVGFSAVSNNTLPTAYIDRLPSFVQTSGNYIIVESDNEQGGSLATDWLIKKGCREIILLTDIRRLSSQQDRVNGYIEAHGAAGIPFNRQNIVGLDEINFDSAYRKINSLLDTGVKFDGIFASTDWLALGAFTAVTERGICIPDDVKLIGYDDISVARYNVKPITTIHQDVEAIVRATVSGLISLSKNGEDSGGQNRIKIPVSLIARETA